MDYIEFKKVVLDDVRADEDELRQLLFSELPGLPVPTVQVSPNTFIERAVNVTRASGDFDLSRLSYIPGHLKHLAPKGRFNKAGEPHFYGTFTDLVNPEATRFYLAAEIDQSILGEQNRSFNYTIGKWKSHAGFPSILFIFKKDFCNNGLIQSAHDRYLNSSEYALLRHDQKEFLEIITLEFAKLKSANGYNITNIVFDFYKSKGYLSVIYPGIPGKYRGNNIAMTSGVFDRSFSFFMGAEFCLTQTGEDIDISVVYKIELSAGNKLLYSKFGEDEMGETLTISK